MKLTPSIEKAIDEEIKKYVQEYKEFLDEVERVSGQVVESDELFKIMWLYEFYRGQLIFLSSHMIRLKERKFRNN